MTCMLCCDGQLIAGCLACGASQSWQLSMGVCSCDDRNKRVTLINYKVELVGKMGLVVLCVLHLCLAPLFQMGLHAALICYCNLSRSGQFLFSLPGCLQFEDMVREYDCKHAIYFKLHQEIQDLSTKVEGLQRVSTLSCSVSCMFCCIVCCQVSQRTRK